MNVTLITFSPTGGTIKCARIIAEALGRVVKEIDLTKREMQPDEVDHNSVAVIAVPSYSGRVPALAVERLRQLKGNGAEAVLVVAYGNRAFEDTMVELEDVACECRFRILAGVAAVARHSIVNKIASERPDQDDMRKLKDFGKQILAKLSNSVSSSVSNSVSSSDSNKDEVSKAKIPGNRPYRKPGTGLNPKTSKKCNDCGKCARECPSGAITLDNPRKIDKDVCIGCVRCVEVCPTGAKYLSPMMTKIVGLMLKKPCATRKEPELFL